MDGAVAKGLGQCFVHESMLVEEREPVEARARDRHLKMVAAACAVLDEQLARIRERMLQQLLERFGRHPPMLAVEARYAPPVPELGLFPLGMVLLPTERVPLHIFEPRYRELIGECVAEEREFGLLLGDDEGLRKIGTRAAVIEVVDRLPDGRLNVVVEGRERFRLVELTDGRSFATGEVEPLPDEVLVSAREDRDGVLEVYRELAELVEAEVDEPGPDSQLLSFEIAARVDFGAPRKQELLELTSEPERPESVKAFIGQGVEGIDHEGADAELSAHNERRVSRRM